MAAHKEDTASNSESTADIDDGWARIRWVINKETFFVCTRTNLALYAIGAEEARKLVDVNVSLPSLVPWILDIHVLSDYKDFVCVLTSTHLVVYHILEESPQEIVVSQKIQLRHFKNPNDLSMRLTVWNNEEGMSRRNLKAMRSLANEM